MGERKKEEGREKNRNTEKRNLGGGDFLFVCLFVEGKCKTSSLSSPHLWLYGGEEWLHLWVRKDGASQPSILTGFHSNKHCTLDWIGKCGVEGWNSTKHWLSERVCLRAHAFIHTVLKCWRGRNQKLTTPTSLLVGGGVGGRMEENTYIHVNFTWQMCQLCWERKSEEMV